MGGRLGIDAKQDAGVAHVAKQNCKTQPVLSTAMLTNERQVGFIEGVQADQLVPDSGDGERLSRSVAERMERRGIGSPG